MTYLELEIRDGPRRRAVPAVALAAMLHVRSRDLHEALFALLNPVRFKAALDPVENSLGEPTEGERFRTFPNPKEDIPERNVRKGEGPGEGNSTRTAREIAALLGDAHSVAGIEVLMREHPGPLVDEALRRTLAMAPEKIRKSRGACFTGIVRTLARSGWSDSTHSHPHGA